MVSWLRSTRAGLVKFSRFWRGGELAGHLDEIRHGAVRGWVWNPAHSERRIIVDVFVDGSFAGQCLANLFRPDLEEAHIGDGRHAFQLNLPPSLSPAADSAVRVFALGERQRYELRASPHAVRREKPLDPKDYLRANFSAVIAAQIPPATIELAPPSDTKKYERLFAPTPIEGAPAILGRAPAAYLDHIRHRHDLARSYDTTVSEAEYAAYLKYYLETYTRRRGQLRAPIPAEDIALLNDGPTSTSPLAKSRAQLLLQHVAPGNSDVERAYLWAAFDSVAYGVEDCLLPEAHKEWLRACDAADDQASFPLSRFMRRFLLGNPFLKGLVGGGEEDRKLAYLALLLFATTNPHFLWLMPEIWVDHFLNGSEASFDEVMQRVFGPCRYRLENWRAGFPGRGYDIDAKRFQFMSARGDRLLSPALRLSREATVDVQLIGPFSRRLGISDSCQTLARALEKLDVSTRFCDFTLDHPNAARNAEGTLPATPGPARINILHLNLEETPGAFAYLADTFTGSHVIGLPYLETPKLGPSQLLGLSLVDEIWAASRFVSDAIGAPDITRIVGTAARPMPSIGRAAARSRIYGGIAGAQDFLFLTACDALSGAHRKNPIGVIRAFLNAFPNDANVKLVIKTHSLERVGDAGERRIFEQIAGIAAECPRIVWIDRFLDEPDHAALLEGADALVSLHRAEGFGYHILEAMALGTPVIATAYSGNMDFCSEATAGLVPYTLVNIEHGQYHRASASQTWAEPDFAASVAAMRLLKEDEQTREARAAAAKAFISANFSLDVFARRIDGRLQQILGDLRNRQVA